MSARYDAAPVDKLQMRLAQQEKREQFHYLMRILPESMNAELRAEQQLRGEREGVGFYVGEVIGSTTGTSPQAPVHATRQRRPVAPRTPIQTGASLSSKAPTMACSAGDLSDQKHGWQGGTKTSGDATGHVASRERYAEAMGAHPDC